MINFKKELVSNLSTIGLPVYHEHFLTQDTEMPCISYYQLNNQQDETGTDIIYSTIWYVVKVWATNPEELNTYIDKVDGVMRDAGFRRSSSNELWVDGVGQIANTYRAKGIELF